MISVCSNALMQHICCQKQIILEVIKMCKKKESINVSKLQLGGLQLNKRLNFWWTSNCNSNDLRLHRVTGSNEKLNLMKRATVQPKAFIAG